MGKRLLVIDNRQERAQDLMNDQWTLFLGQSNVQYTGVIPTEEELYSYDVIAIHGSLISENHLEDVLAQLVKNKYVVIFSGAVSQMVISNEGHLLKVPAVSFYSSNLIPFCNYLNNLSDPSVQLLGIVYGIEHCRFPMLLLLRQLLWQYPEEERDYKKNVKIEELQNSLSIMDLRELGGEIDKELKSL